MTKTATVHAQQRWEYCLLERRTETTLVKDINTEGDLGWELVQILKHEKPKGTFWTAFMKRPHTGPARTAATAETSVSSGLEAAKTVEPTAKPSKPGSAEDSDIFKFQS